MSTLTDGEIKMLESCPNTDAWNVACEVIRANHDGGYPSDWHRRVLAPGGVVDQMQAKWNEPNAFAFKIEEFPGTKVR